MTKNRSPRSHPPSGRKKIFRLIGFLCYLAVLLIVGELTARLLTPSNGLPEPPPGSTIDPYQPNPYIVKMRPYIYFHIPGSKYIQARSGYHVQYEINKMGFRGPAISSHKPRGQKRLLVLGDSIIEGQGSEIRKTFPYLLGRNLQAHHWEVVNMGVQGASPIYFAANMDRYLSVNPDAVLIVLNENDLHEDRLREAEYFKMPLLDNRSQLLAGETNRNILFSSRLYSVVCRIRPSLFKTPVEKIIMHNRKIADARHGEIALFKTPPDRIPPAFVERQWHMSSPYLDYVVHTFREHDILVLVSNMSLHTFGPDSPYYEHIHKLDNRISAWAGKREVPFLSLVPTPGIVYMSKPISKVLIKDDDHPTGETHRVLEEIFRPWVLRYLHADKDL